MAKSKEDVMQKQVEDGLAKPREVAGAPPRFPADKPNVIRGFVVGKSRCPECGKTDPPGAKLSWDWEREWRESEELQKLFPVMEDVGRAIAGAPVLRVTGTTKDLRYVRCGRCGWKGVGLAE